MNNHAIQVRARRWTGGSGLLFVASGMIGGCFIPSGPGGEAKFYEQKALVSDQAGMAPNTDPHLINPWGLAYAPDSGFLVANNGSGTSTVYSGTGQPRNDIAGGAVRLPARSGGQVAPTGLVRNEGSGFEIGSGGESGPSQFLIATEEGTILGWSPEVDPRNAEILIDNSGAESGYMGLAMARSGGQTMLYATNFRSGTIDVFGEDLAPATDLADDAFQDPAVPAGYLPFGIHNVGGRIYVTWVKGDDRHEDAVPGVGLGYVDVFDPDGALVDTVASAGRLNAPWAVVRASSGFGQFGDALLIGNFGDGMITAYDEDSYEVLGQLQSSNDEPIVIDGLWGMMFGTEREDDGTDRLYYTAGPDNESHGEFGYLAPMRRKE